MTFKEWQATRKRLPINDRIYGKYFEDWDLSEQYNEVLVYGSSPENMLGYIGINKCYRPEKDTPSMFQFDMYDLVLENMNWWVSRDGLDDIEHRLYDWLKCEGTFDSAEEQLERSLECDVHNLNMRIGQYLVQKHPEAKTGDIDPMAQAKLDFGIKSYCKHWVKNNVDWRKKYG